MKYINIAEYNIVKRGIITADLLWPRLAPGQIVVLDADLMHHHVYILCPDQESVKQAIQDTLYTSKRQEFIIVERKS